MQQLKHLGAFTADSRDTINSNFAGLGIGNAGRIMYLEPVAGLDASAEPDNPDKPYRTLAAAYAACVAGKNDVVRLVSNGASTSTARVDTAFTWAKNATHLIGDTAPVRYGQRARIAPTTTTVGAAGNKDYMTVSASGCVFQNVQIWAGFATGIAATIALAVSGSRNLFKRMQVAGHADAASAQDTASASLALSGSENLFEQCVFGTDTVLRTVLNSTVLFSGGAARNHFDDCTFAMWTSATTALHLQVRAANANGADRETVFNKCRFLNALNITSAVTLAAVCKSIASGINGYFLMQDCVRVATDWGTDSTSLALIQVCGPGTGGTAGDDVGRATAAVAS